MNFCTDKTFENSFRFKSSLNNKVKSSLCKNFTQTGLCPYADKCQFAHGTHELRCNAEMNISYKTKYCNSFLNKKCCIYGFRCNFIHKNSAAVDEQ
jgi:tristetraprolin